MSDSPMWKPSSERIQQANITEFTRQIEQRHEVAIQKYDDLHQWSVSHINEFWLEIWNYGQVIGSPAKPEKAIDIVDAPFYEQTWFPGVTLNYAENLLRNRSEQLAIISVQEDGKRVELSYGDLYRKVARCAAALKAQGVSKGDRVAGYVANTADTVIAMLATTSIGAIWSSCSPDFGVPAVFDRFSQIEPVALFTLQNYPYNGKRHDVLEKACEVAGKIPSLKTIIVSDLQENNTATPEGKEVIGFDAFCDSQDAEEIEFERVEFKHPLFILYSSGTTGVPKCIVHGHGGTLLQHIKEHQLHTDIKPGTRLFYYTTCGWMMWNWLVSGLASQATLVLYEGSPTYPKGNTLFNLIDSENIEVFGTSASFISAAEKLRLKPIETHKLTSLKTILSTGSPLLAHSYDYVYSRIKQDVCLSSISGGTDLISCFALGNPTLPVYKERLQCLGLGMDVDVFNDAGEPIVGEPGELVCKSPFPSCPVSFWNDPGNQRFHDAYFAHFENIWTHGDFARIEKHEEATTISILGRSDNTLNPGGVRIGTAEIYRQVELVDEVKESAVIDFEMRGRTELILFVVLKEGYELDDALVKHIKNTIKSNTTSRHVPAKIYAVKELPKTMNGKLSEAAIKKALMNKGEYKNLAIVNPESLEEIVSLVLG